jgi:predicted metal-dependent phosphoesterase TrpH
VEAPGPHPFARDGEWLRCALHTHTTNSDGELPPPMLVRHYEWAGFDVLAITDHWVRTDAPSRNGLLVVPSTELDAALDERGRGAHVLALGVTDDPVHPEGPFASLAETVGWTNGHGGVAYIAHTYWSGLRAEDFESCDGLLGLEVYNAGCELEIGRGVASLHWDDVLDGGRLFFGLATDDSHHPGFDSSFGWVWARCAERSTEAVLDALRSGAFYSSTGPVVHSLEVDGDAVTVRCSPARSVTLVGTRQRGARVNAGRLGYPLAGEILDLNDDGLVVAARLERPRSPYGRLEVEDAQGRKAWTNPLWFAR